MTTKEEQKEKNRARANAWAKVNPDRVKAYKEAYYRANAERLKAKSKAFREANPDKIKSMRRSYYDNNSEKVKADSTAYYKANPEKVLTRLKSWRKANPEKVKEWRKAFQSAHPERNRDRAKLWSKTTNGKLSKGKSDDYRMRNLGSNMLNAWFKGCHRHHINTQDVICIPKELHEAHKHNHRKPETMIIINTLALNYMGKQI